MGSCTRMFCPMHPYALPDAPVCFKHGIFMQLLNVGKYNEESKS